MRGLAWAMGALVAALAASHARADLQLCNKSSYVLDLALGISQQGATATRGWFRVNPGQCRNVVQGTLEAEHIYVHARALALYGPPPLPPGHIDLCVADDNFVIAGAQACRSRSGQQMVRFSAVKPSETDQSHVAYIGEEGEYSPEQARLAGLQRLLVLAGYDASPIDGIEGKKTEVALAQFTKDAKLDPGAEDSALFAALAAAAEATAGIGFTWCNETEHLVMAAIGTDENGALMTRGWYRIEPGKCLKPDMTGRPARVFSFAEAVDREGQAVRRADQTIVWGGTTPLCTRNVRFEISDHVDCLARGLNATGFAAIELAGKPGAVVRLRE